MILYVAVTDLLWMIVILAMAKGAPNRWTRNLLVAVAIYCLIEALFHVKMEEVAGQLLWR